jgi:aspartyl-tRNA(Asn)/glutamyl-tRNA(Gln) amidotransferase subunit A
MEADIFTQCNTSPATGAQKSPLTGKSFAVQPNVSVRCWRAEAGAPALKGFVAVEDATVIDRLQKAGATLVGATRMSEMGFGRDGDTTTLPLSQGRVDMALMTDMMGEARIAAARIGAYGFKPTHGIVSRFGWIGLAPSMECCGLLARTPKEMAGAMGVMAGGDDKDFSMHRGEMPDFEQGEVDAHPVRNIGVVKELVAALSETEARALRSSLDRLGALGLDVREVGLSDHGLFPIVHRVIGSVEASSSCGKFDGVRYGHRTTAAVRTWNEMYLQSRGESFGMPLKAYLFQGAYFQFENYAAFENAARIRARLIRNMDGLFTQVDALVSPTRREAMHNTPDMTVGAVYDECALTLPANVAGLPAVQIPGLVTDGDVDLGLQIIGSRLSDARLLSLAVRLSHGA